MHEAQRTVLTDGEKALVTHRRNQIDHGRALLLVHVSAHQHGFRVVVFQSHSEENFSKHLYSKTILFKQPDQPVNQLRPESYLHCLRFYFCHSMKAASVMAMNIFNTGPFLRLQYWADY